MIICPDEERVCCEIGQLMELVSDDVFSIMSYLYQPMLAFRSKCQPELRSAGLVGSLAIFEAGCVNEGLLRYTAGPDGVLLQGQGECSGSRDPERGMP